MPLVRVEILKGKTQEYKKAILDGVHAALVETFRIPDDDRTQCLYELEKDCFEIPPGKTGKMTLIELTVFKGRSLEAKKNLYSAIVRNLAQAPGIDGNDILIVLNELPMENWGVRGGIPASEVDFGFKIEV